ncbi:MAG: hypothetical protein ACJAT6_000727 [Akkermansiaceae bacterium]|jgi:hypothetical protein|tara:strand:+ start:17638 stop:17865 length:228 start_codon:yes stop_codon:yes gene_type:complete
MELKEENQSEIKTTISKWVAFLLDDFATSTAGLPLLAGGAIKRVPKSVSLRMMANWTLNTLIGAIAWYGPGWVWS